jgi:hypothetical protein
MRQQLSNLTRPLRRQACKHILQVSIRIMPIEPCRLDAFNSLYIDHAIFYHC